jgi:hypothetical protein
VKHAALGGQGELQVLEHAVALEHRGALKFAADPELRDLVLRHLDQRLLLAVFTDQVHIACRWPCLAGDAVHQRGLASTVRADDAAQLTAVERHRQIGERLETIELHADVVHPQVRQRPPHSNRGALCGLELRGRLGGQPSVVLQARVRRVGRGGLRLGNVRCCHGHRDQAFF